MIAITRICNKCGIPLKGKGYIEVLPHDGPLKVDEEVPGIDLCLPCARTMLQIARRKLGPDDDFHETMTHFSRTRGGR